MALPVAQIMSQLQTGNCEDIEEDDIAEGPELEDEGGNEELFKDTKLEIIEGPDRLRPVQSSVLRERILKVPEVKSEMKICFTLFKK